MAGLAIPWNNDNAKIHALGFLFLKEIACKSQEQPASFLDLARRMGMAMKSSRSLLNQ